MPPSLAVNDDEMVAVRERVEVSRWLVLRGSETAVDRLVADGAGRVTGVVAVAVCWDDLEQGLVTLIEVHRHAIGGEPDEMRFIFDSFRPPSLVGGVKCPAEDLRVVKQLKAGCVVTVRLRSRRRVVRVGHGCLWGEYPSGVGDRNNGRTNALCVYLPCVRVRAEKPWQPKHKKRDVDG